MRRIIAAFALVAGAATAAHAQGAAMPHGSHEGLWTGFGGGVGLARIDCARCGPLLADDPWSGGIGFGVFGAIGTTLSPQLLIGGELNLYGKRNGSEQRDVAVGAVSAVLRYYPAARFGLYLEGGGGPGFSTLAGGPGLIASNGWALQASVGFDAHSHRRFTITPYGSVVQLFSEGGSGDNRGLRAQGPSNPYYVQAGLAVHWY